MPIVRTTTKKVLKHLSRSSDYGYSISRKLRMDRSVVYRILRTLRMYGYIRPADKKLPNGKVRRYYGLTPKGKKLLEVI